MKTLIFTLLFSLTAFADTNDYEVLPQGKVHQGDYFATGKTIEVSGTVLGDVYAFGTEVIIDGSVRGSVIAAAGSISIIGTVEGNARLGGGQIEISGSVLKNVTAAAASIELDRSGKIGGNAVLSAGIFEVEGTIGGNLTLSGSKLRLQGTVGGNVDAGVTEIRIGSRATIGGNLKYSSDEAIIDPGAKIQGSTTVKPSFIRRVIRGKWHLFGARITGLLMNFLFTFVIGVFILKLFPRKLDRTLDALRKKPWKSLFAGLLTMILLPIISVLLFITILGLPIGLALLALSLLGFYSAKIFPVLWFSNRLFWRWIKDPHSLWRLFFGLILFFLIIQIPFLGSFLSLAFTLIGLGALVLGRAPQKRRKARPSR